jgi:SAM-dependent methyltransferase
MTEDATERFSQRAENYARYRPLYPPQIVDYLKIEASLKPQAIIADVGSGTGILTGLWASRGYRVYGVEPNDEMRAMAERQLGHYGNFDSVAAPAEATTLPDRHVDFISVGQAFHWFDLDRTAVEFRRILKRDGHVVLLWNRPRNKESEFNRASLEIQRRHRLQGLSGPTDKDAEIASFFGGRMRKEIFDNTRFVSWEQFRGRFLSSSWAPLPDDERFEPVLADLRRLFDRYAVDGRFKEELVTELYLAQFSSF